MPQPESRFGDPEHTLFLLDISSFIFRAFFGIRRLTSPAGEPTNAVYGVATMLARIAKEGKPEYLVVTYDSKEPSFREEIYPEYKANRSEPPDDLIPQFGRVDEMVEAFGIHSYRKPGVEADDLIASLARQWCRESKKNRVVIVTGDKDLMQLVDDRVLIWDTMAEKIYGPEEVLEKMGVKPEQVRDYLGLVGDSSDNIPGVAGIGPKTAADLLKEHGDLESVLKAAAGGKVKGKRGETLVSEAESARLSAKLATVREDLDLHLSREDFRYHFHLTPECRKLFEELGFHTLVQRWGTDEPAAVAPAIGAVAVTVADAPIAGGDELAFRAVQTEKQLQDLLQSLERASEFGFDVETTSLNPREAVLVGVAISTDPSVGHYIPLNHRGLGIAEGAQLPEKRVLEALKPFLTDPRRKKIGQNLKYDVNVMACLGIDVDGIGGDTMVAGYVLEPENRQNLEALARHYLGYQVMTYEQVCGSGKDQLSFDQVAIDQATRYSAEDAVIALKLWHELKDKIQREHLMDVYSQVDLPLVQVLARMEREGVCIDTDWLRQLSEEFSRDLRRIEERIQAFTKGPVNLNSPKQLAVLLFDELKLPPQGKTKTGYSTDASVLDALSPLHEVPRLLLEYREISKLKGTYVDPLPQMRDSKTGRIHASFHQTVAATGRLSSSDPNLQNIPIRTERGRKIRRAFIPSPGNVLVAADYSQIELRLLASMSGDPELMRSFKNDEDVHRRTAGEIFGVPAEKVDDRQRGIAKAINFGLMYGKTAFGLAQELRISRKEAQAVIDRYFERYSAVKTFLDAQIDQAKEVGYATTLMGRKRKLPDIHSKNQAIRGNAERMAMNTPIQGTAADLMKLAMIEIDEKLREGGFRSKLIIQVHDEVVLDCPKGEAPEVLKLITRAMEGAGGVGAAHSAMRLQVPLKVNSATGGNWMDL